MPHKSEFNLQRYQKFLNACFVTGLSLDSYLLVFVEINRLMSACGFHVVYGYLSDKLTLLENHRNALHGRKYEKIASMLDYEKEFNSLDEQPQTCTRLVLQFNRALNFANIFIEKLKYSTENDNPNDLAAVVYGDVLAGYHSPATQEIVRNALNTLPNRKQFFEEIIFLDPRQGGVIRLMENSIAIGRQVFLAIEKLYQDRQLLNLN